MKVIQKIFNLINEDYYITHLRIINSLLPVRLSDKEIEVLAAFMSLDKSITEGNCFNSVARKKVQLLLNLSPAGLSNHLKSMLKKQFITENTVNNIITIKPFLLPEDTNQGYQFKIVKQ
jgi:DNA-binding MarR family transcriptional regulator